MFFHEYDPHEVFSAMSQAGLDSIEFWPELSYFWMRGMHIEELTECKEKFGGLFPIAMHTPIFDLNPCSFNPKVVEASGYYTVKTARMLEELGGGVLTIHPGKRTSKRPITEYDKALFNKYLKTIEENLPGNVKVALENMPPAVNAHMTTSSEIRKVLDEYSWLYFTFDYAHAQLSGNPFSFIDECGDRMINIHSSLGQAGRMHTPLKGTKEGDELKRKLAEINYSGLVTFEFEDLSITGKKSYEEKVKIIADERSYFRS